MLSVKDKCKMLSIFKLLRQLKYVNVNVFAMCKCKCQQDLNLSPIFFLNLKLSVEC